jgi:MFS family permease
MATTSAARIPDAWIVIGCAALLMALTMGSRSTFGLFVSPLNSATGLGIATISLAVAASHLAWGAAQPVAGVLSDRYGAAPVVVGGGLLLALCSALIPFVNGAVGLFLALTGGAIAAAAAAGNAVLLGLVSRHVPADARGLAAGIVGAGGSAGQLILAPATQALIAGVGWVNAMLALAALALLALPLARGLRPPPARPDADAVMTSAGSATPDGDVPGRAHADPEDHWARVRAAVRSPAYWMVTGAFFMCGFHVSFLLAHMPAVIDLCGLPAGVAGVWIGIVGLCNIVGSIGAGLAIRRLPMKHVLTALYMARALGVAVFLAAPKTEWTLYAFAVWMGVTYMATLPPTSGLIGKLFGVRQLATLLGITLFVHQIGSFLGVWLGGVVVEATGSYDLLWMTDIVLASIAAAIHLPLREDAQAAALSWRLGSGRAVSVRPVQPDDAPAVQAFVRALSPQSRLRRFFSPIRELAPSALARLTCVDGRRDQVLLAFAGPPDGGTLVAIGQYAGLPDAGACEVAVVVADRWQGQGLGRVLMTELVARARRAGYARVEGDVLADNRPMLTLARRCGFALTPLDPARSVLHIARTIGRALAAPTPARRPPGNAPRGSQAAAA